MDNVDKLVIAQISQKVNHFTSNIKFSPLLLSSIISQFSKKVKQSAPTTRKGRERRSREHLYDGRARVRFAPQAQPHDTYIRGDTFDLFSNLWYNKNEKHFKNETINSYIIKKIPLGCCKHLYIVFAAIRGDFSLN